MPAFSFEKILPPEPHGPRAPVEPKPRGVILQVLDRLADARARRVLKQDDIAVSRDPAVPE